MLIRYGYEMAFAVSQATPMLCLISIHTERQGDVRQESFKLSPDVPVTTYFDLFGNLVRRFVVPPEGLSMTLDGIIRDSGLHDPVVSAAAEIPVADLPHECLV
ncbi:MAG: transglutaminase family protein, partial [Parvibaculaceae bacterium]